MSELYVALSGFDSKHNRSNPLFHQGIVLIEKDEQDQQKIIDCYGFYSHPSSDVEVIGGRFNRIIRLIRDIPYLNRIIPGFRLEGAYVELKREPICECITQGMTLSALQKLEGNSKENFENEVKNIFEKQNRFFMSTDRRWLRDLGLNATKIEELLEINLKKYKDARAICDFFESREERITHYLKENSGIIPNDYKQNGILNWQKIEKRRIHLREEKFIDPEHSGKPDEFNMSFISEAKVCKTLACRFLMNCFDECSMQYRYFASKLSNVFRRNVPRWTEGMTKQITFQPLPETEPYSTKIENSSLLRLEYQWSGGLTLIDLSHHQREKEALHFLKSFLMAVDGDWCRNYLEGALAHKEIKATIEKIHACFESSEKGFKQKFPALKKDLEQKKGLIAQAHQFYLYQQKHVAQPVLFPQDISSEMGVQIGYLQKKGLWSSNASPVAFYVSSEQCEIETKKHKGRTKKVFKLNPEQKFSVLELQESTRRLLFLRDVLLLDEAGSFSDLISEIESSLNNKEKEKQILDELCSNKKSAESIREHFSKVQKEINQKKPILLGYDFNNSKDKKAFYELKSYWHSALPRKSLWAQASRFLFFAKSRLETALCSRAPNCHFPSATV